jgi:hypothetical protein
LVGCSNSERSYTVKVIVPDNYRGLVKIKFDPQGEKEIWENSVLVFRIPKSGVLITQGQNPYLKWGPGITIWNLCKSPETCFLSEASDKYANHNQSPAWTFGQPDDRHADE